MTNTIQGPEDKAPLLEHLLELRSRLMISLWAILLGFFICFNFSEEIFHFLLRPLKEAMGGNARLIFTALHEAFFTYMKVAFYAGLFLALPVVFNQIWLFIAPGLYSHEKKKILPALIITPALFFIGGIFAYVVVFPFAFKYFLSFSTEGIEALPKVDEYLDLVIRMMFAFGITFESPLLLLLLVKFQLVSVAALVDKRRYAIVGVFIIAALLAPPDPYSQVLLAVPLMAMYEIAIFGGRIIERNRPREEAPIEEEPA